MNIKQMQQFIVIAEEQNMHRAAEKLYISQPALSKLTHSIEEEFNQRIFDRNGRNIELNEKGKFLLDRAKKIVAEYDLINEYFDKKDDFPKNINFSALYSPLEEALLMDFYRENQNFKINRFGLNCRDALRMLMNKNLDLCFTDEDSLRSLSIEQFSMLTNVMLIRNRLYLATPAGHRFYDRVEINAKELDGETLIVGNTVKGFLNPMLEKNNVNCNIIEYDPERLKRISYTTKFLRPCLAITYDFLKFDEGKIHFVKVNGKETSKNVYLSYFTNSGRDVLQFAEFVSKDFYKLLSNRRNKGL